jgi:hypothetical protein
VIWRAEARTTDEEKEGTGEGWAYDGNGAALVSVQRVGGSDVNEGTRA